MKMLKIRRNTVLAATMLFTISIGGVMPALGQDLVPVSDIGGGSSVFVFRGSKGSSKKFSANQRAVRSKTQRMETAKKIKTQYDNIAKTTPLRVKSTVVTPDKVPSSVKSLTKEQGATLFAGVGEYYLGQNDTENSISFFREALGLSPKHVKAKEGISEALTVKANALFLAEDIQKAKAFYLEAIKNNPNNAAANFGLGEVYTEMDQRDDAIASYEKALKSSADLTEIYLPLGVLYMQKGEIAKADELLTKAVAISENNAEAQVMIGSIRLSQNRNDEALAAFRKATAIDPTNADANYYTGEVQLRLGNHNEAVTAFQKAIAQRANFADAYRGLGQAYFEQKRYAEAVDALKLSVKAKNDSAETYAALGEAQRMVGNYTQAESAYATAKDLLARNPETSKDEIADLYSKIGYSIGRQCEVNMRNGMMCQWPNAVAAFQKAVEYGGSAIDYANLGWAYYSSARADINARQPDVARPKLELAKTNLQRALTGSPKIIDGVQQNLGGVLIDLGDYRGAIDALTPVVQHQPDWTFSKYALGTAYFKSNDFDSAARMFSAAADKEAKNIGYLSSLGYAYIKLRNAKEVKKVIDRLKKLNPTEANNMEIQMKLANLK